MSLILMFGSFTWLARSLAEHTEESVSAGEKKNCAHQHFCEESFFRFAYL